MKVGFFKSLAFKLFMLITIVAGSSIAIISWKSRIEFEQILTTQVESSIESQAEKVSTGINNTLKNWISQVNVALPHFRLNDKEFLGKQLESFLDQNNDFAGITIFAGKNAGIFIGSAYSKLTSDPRFEEKIPEKVFKKVPILTQSFIQKSEAKMERSFIQDLEKGVGLPILNLGLKFSIDSTFKQNNGKNGYIYVVVSAWKTQIAKALPKGYGLEAFVVENSGSVFSAINQKHMEKSVGSLEIVKTAFKSNAPTGLKPFYLDPMGKTKYIGAYSSIDGFDNLKIVVQRDIEVAFSPIQKSQEKTALWIVFIVLIAIFFSFAGATDITKTLRELTGATEKVAKGDFNVNIIPRSRDEVGVLSLK